MAYDRYDNRDGRRDERRDYRGGDDDDRGFFERARDEVQSWFGDEEAERRRMQDERMGHPGSDRYSRDRDDRGAFFGGHDRDGQRGEYRGGRDRPRESETGFFSGGGRDRHDRDEDRGRGLGGGQSSNYGRSRDEGDYRQYGRGAEGGGGRYEQGRYPGSYGQTGGGSFSPRQGGRDHSFGRDDDRSDFGRGSFANEQRGAWSGREDHDHRSAGEYRGRSPGDRSGMGGQDFARSQYGRQDFAQDQDRDRGDRYNYGGWGDHDSRSQGSGGRGLGAAAAGAAAFGAGRMGSHHDEHYSSWRQRQIDELDNDYHAYREEHRSKFENEFSGWRQQRQTKRQMLSAIRPHDQVVDLNGEHIGTVDKVHGDTIVLTRDDPEAGGVHRSFSCSLLERVEGGRVYLGGSKETIRSQLREEREGGSRGGGLLSGLFGTRRDDEVDDERRDRNSQPIGSGSSDQTGDGPHVLDRSFSGTYEDDANKRA